MFMDLVDQIVGDLANNNNQGRAFELLPKAFEIITNLETLTQVSFTM
jgi:hypothetical protein